MKGHLKKRSKDSWTIIVDLGLKPNGKRNQKWKTVKGTKKEAEAKLADLLSEYGKGLYVEPSKQSLKDYLTQWVNDLESQNKDNIKTIERYTSICDNYINPRIGGTKLNDLKPVHIKNLYTELRKSGRVDGKGGLSERTVLHTHRLLNNALNTALKLGLISINPCYAVDTPSPKQSHRETFNEKETINLLDKAKGTRLYIPVLIAVTTGLRRGEVFALRWEDIDFDKGQLFVKRTAVYDSKDKEVVFKAPKTDRSRRTIPLPSTTLQALRNYKAERAEIFLKLGEGMSNDNLIFNGFGGFDKPNQITVAYSAFIKKHGFKHVTFHDLRHTHATLLLEKNTNLKVVSDRLGHSTITLTADTYSHVSQEVQREASDEIDKIFSCEE